MNSVAARREFFGPAKKPGNCNIAAWEVIAPRIAFPFAAELSMEQGQSELRTLPQGDFPWMSEWTLCTGHIPPVQHAADELDAACAKAAPVPPKRASSRIMARTRFIAFSYHRRTFWNKRPEPNRATMRGPLPEKAGHFFSKYRRFVLSPPHS